MTKKICAIIPAYNEAAHLKSVITGIANFGIDIYLIDDGSSDNTRKIAENSPVNLICHDKNLGKGRSLRDGFNSALQSDYELFITIDGDGQHDPDEIPGFLRMMENENFDIVAGNRMSNADNMPKKRFKVNTYASRIMSNLCRQNMPDPLCGYRLIQRKVLEELELNCNGFNIVNEIVIKAARKDFKIGHLEIKCLYGKEKSHIRPLRDLYYFIKLVREINKNETSGRN